MSLSFSNSAFDNTSNVGSNYVLVNNSNQTGSMTLAVNPPDNMLWRSLVTITSNNATPPTASLSFGDSNNRMILNIGQSNLNLLYNASALVSCNLVPIYNSNVEVAVRSRLNNQKVYYNHQQIINYVGSNLDWNVGNYQWSATSTTSNQVAVQYPLVESIITLSNSVEILASSKMANVTASNITANSITTPAITAMSNLIYSGTQNITSINTSNLQVLGSIFFDSNQVPNITAVADSVTIQVGGTSNDSFNVNKNGGVSLFKIQSGLSNTATLNASLDAPSYTESTVPLSTKYALSNAQSNYFTVSNQTAFSNYVASNYQLITGTVPWSNISGAPSFGSQNSNGSFGNMVLQGLVSGVAGTVLTMAASGLSINGTSIMQWGTSGFTALQSATSSFALDGVNAAINGLAKLTAPNGTAFMSYDAPSQKISLLADYMKSGMTSIRLDGTSNILAITSGSNSASNVVFSPSGNYMGSNLGIGTSNSTYGLTLGGACSTLGVDNNSLFYSKNGSGTYEQFLCPRSNDNVMYLNYGSAGGSIRNNAGTTTMFMSSNNNVGIGITNPACQLHLNAASTGSIALSGANGTQIFTGSSSTFNGIIMALGYNNTNNRQLLIMDGSNASANSSNVALRLVASGNNATFDAVSTDGSAQKQTTIGNINGGVTMPGNVGIGTTNPVYKLDVTANSRFSCAVVGDLGMGSAYAGFGHSNCVSATQYGFLQDSVANTYVNCGSSSSFITFRSSNQNWGFWNSNGLGIGTTTPSYNLDVSGNARASTSLITPTVTASTIVTSPVFQCSAGPMNIKSEFDIYYTADFDGNNGGAQHVFYSSSNEKMRITTAGSVGIGTNNPLYKLDVNGAINTNNTVSASNLTVSATVTSSNIVATGGITTTGVAKANKLSCGYVSVNDFSQNQSQYALDLFSY